MSSFFQATRQYVFKNIPLRAIMQMMGIWLPNWAKCLVSLATDNSSQSEKVVSFPVQQAVTNTGALQHAGRALKEYGNSILRLAFSYVHNMKDAEDILQDTLIQYMRKAPTFEGAEHEKAWLLCVTINISKNKLKRSHLHREMELSDFIPDSRETEDMAFIWECVRQLPSKYSEVVHLYYHEGYPTAEVAKLLNKNESTVRTLLSRARGHLKKTLKEVYDFEK